MAKKDRSIRRCCGLLQTDRGLDWSTDQLKAKNRFTTRIKKLRPDGVKRTRSQCSERPAKSLPRLCVAATAILCRVTCPFWRRRNRIMPCRRRSCANVGTAQSCFTAANELRAERPPRGRPGDTRDASERARTRLRRVWNSPRRRSSVANNYRSRRVLNTAMPAPRGRAGALLMKFVDVYRRRRVDSVELVGRLIATTNGGGVEFMDGRSAE